MDKVLDYLSTLDSFSLIILVGGIIFGMYILPNVIKRMGIVKLGPLEMEHKHQTQNYEVNRKIEEIDIENRESLWEMTEDIFAVAAESSTIKCDAAVGYILAGISSPIRNMVLINHIAPKLVISYEPQLKAKINRGISRAIKDARGINHGHGCPVVDDIMGIKIDRYAQIVDDWIQRARSITVKACQEKVHVYESAIEQTSARHWKEIYNTCCNKKYIRGMGYDNR